ncbi:MAG TPA: hypothetical protein VHG91_01985 [Longimicrobium sp.]|nr:hypothetical protein [Longimicrobium sp.]
MGRVIALIVVAGLLAAGWFFRDLIPGPWQKERETEFLAVSPEAAQSAEDKLERLRTQGDTIRLSDVELTSLIRYRFQDRLAGQLDSASIDFAGDTVRVSGRLPTDRLPDTREVRAVRTFLPDTADVRVEGRVRTLEPGRIALRVDQAAFARVNIPQNVFPDALQRVGRKDEPGLAENELALRLPPGVGEARVEGGELVLSPAGGQ